MDEPFASLVSRSHRAKDSVTDNRFGLLGRAFPETQTLALGQDAMPMEAEMGEVMSWDEGSSLEGKLR
jgi:hypothetical protein